MEEHLLDLASEREWRVALLRIIRAVTTSSIMVTQELSNDVALLFELHNVIETHLPAVPPANEPAKAAVRF